MKKLEEMTLEELREEEEDAMLNMREATLFNDDASSYRIAGYLVKVAAEIEKRRADGQTSLS